MEILGLSHPVVSTTAATMQKAVDQAKPVTSVEMATNRSDTSAAAMDQLSLGLGTDQSVRPVNATSESVLEARTPIETGERPVSTASDDERPPENRTYEFPEELPMNFLEMIDMWRVDEPTQQIDVTASDGLTISDPASAGEMQRVNRTA